MGIGDALRDGADEALLFESLTALDREAEFGPRIVQAKVATQSVLVLLALPLEWMVLASLAASFGRGVAEPVRSIALQKWAKPGQRATAASRAALTDMVIQTVGLVVFGWWLERVR